jgi:DNA-binding transcriptional ArsR family regulator
MARETSQTLDRGLRLLELLAARDQGQTVTDLAEALGVARPVVYRLLATLEDHGLAAVDRTGGYRLGLGLVRLSGRLLPALRAAAEPHLRVLADQVGATAHLTVADGEDGVAVAVIEPSATSYHVAYRTGTRHPLERGAAGQAILGGRRPPAHRRRWYLTTGELQEGAVGLATPLGHSQIEASVGVVALGRIDERRIGPAVVGAAAALRADLPGPPAGPDGEAAQPA